MKSITQISVSLRNKPSALYSILGGFATNRVKVISVSPLESVELGKSVEAYVIMVEANLESSGFKSAMEEASFHSNSIEMLETIKVSSPDTQKPNNDPLNDKIIFTSNTTIKHLTHSTSTQIRISIEEFLNESGLNEIPEELRSLSEVENYFSHIASSLVYDDMAYVPKAEYIRKLETRIIELEKQLREVSNTKEASLLKTALIQQAGKSLGDWKMWSLIIGTGFMLFSDTEVLNALNKIPKILDSMSKR